jgi:hypothetical protein
MRHILATLLTFVLSAVLCGVTFAKPDSVDGINVPEGRIPQEISRHRHSPDLSSQGTGAYRARVSVDACGPAPVRSTHPTGLWGNSRQTGHRSNKQTPRRRG